MIANGGALLLRDVTLDNGQRADVHLCDGRIDAVTEPGLRPAPDGPHDTTLNLSGHLLLPAPMEIHAHLDKAYTADLVVNPAGDLPGAIKGWLAARASFPAADIARRAAQAIAAYAGNGATAIRTHVDLGEDIGLRAVESVLSAPALVQVQVVAFAATPLSGMDGARNRALLRAALDAGATVVGACPGLDPDPAACIAFCLETAGAYQVPLDLHIDEWLQPQPCTLPLLAEAVLAMGFPYQVTASHCVSLSMMPADRIRAIAEQVARAGIAVACLPQTNLYLQARQHDSAPPRGLAPIRALRQAGVTVTAGADNLQDPFHPLGRADPLETAALLVQAGHDTPEQAYAAVSSDARRAAGLPEVAVAPGYPAELLAIRAVCLRTAIATASPDRFVIHQGRLIAQSTVTREILT